MAELKLSLIIRAVDLASGVVRKINSGIGRMTDGVMRFTRFAGKMAIVGAAAFAVLSAGAFLAAHRLFDLVEGAAAAGDAAFNNSKKVGLSIREYQRLGYAAKISNLEAGELAVGLKFLAVNAASAAKGGKEDAAAFKALGVRVKDAHGQLRPVGDLLGDLADRFAVMKDGPGKAAAAMQIFGRSGTEMIPFLNEGKAGIRALGDEAERLGIVMSDDAAAASDDFNDKLDALKSSVLGLKIGIGAGLLPTVTRYVVKLTDFIAAHRPQIIKAFTTIVEKLFKAFGKIDLDKVIDGILKVGDAFAKIDVAKLIGDIATLVSGMAALFRFFGGLSGIIDVGIVAVIGRIGWVLGAAAVAIGGFFGVAAFPIAAAAVAITGIVALAALLWRHWSEIGPWFAGLWAGIKRGAAALLGWIGQSWKARVDQLVTNWNGIAGFFTDLWSRVSATFKAGVAMVWNAMPGWMQGLLKGAWKGAVFAFHLFTGQPGAPGAPPTGPGRGLPPPPQLGPPRSQGRSALAPASYGGSGQWNGKLTVELKGDQAARVRSVKSSNSDFDLLVDRGLNLGGA